MRKAVDKYESTQVNKPGGLSGVAPKEEATIPICQHVPDPIPAMGASMDLQWPLLSEVGLGAAQLRSRMSGIGGSDANIILSGKVEQIIALWREKRGEAEPDDLSERLPVSLGNWTEPFNRQWYEKISGSVVTGIGRSVQCQRYIWRRCTLDGYVEGANAVFEAKHTSAFAKSAAHRRLVQIAGD